MLDTFTSFDTPPLVAPTDIHKRPRICTVGGGWGGTGRRRVGGWGGVGACSLGGVLVAGTRLGLVR